MTAGIARLFGLRFSNTGPRLKIGLNAPTPVRTVYDVGRAANLDMPLPIKNAIQTASRETYRRYPEILIRAWKKNKGANANQVVGVADLSPVEKSALTLYVTRNSIDAVLQAPVNGSGISRHMATPELVQVRVEDYLNEKGEPRRRFEMAVPHSEGSPNVFFAVSNMRYEGAPGG